MVEQWCPLRLIWRFLNAFDFLNLLRVREHFEMLYLFIKEPEPNTWATAAFLPREYFNLPPRSTFNPSRCYLIPLKWSTCLTCTRSSLHAEEGRQNQYSARHLISQREAETRRTFFWRTDVVVTKVWSPLHPLANVHTKPKTYKTRYALMVSNAIQLLGLLCITYVRLLVVCGKL